MRAAAPQALPLLQRATVTRARRLGQQFSADAAFLQDVGVMDYSLLLGVHFCGRKRAGGEGSLATAMSSGRQDRHVQPDRWERVHGHGACLQQRLSQAVPAGSARGRGSRNRHVPVLAAQEARWQQGHPGIPYISAPRRRVRLAAPFSACSCRCLWASSQQRASSAGCV